MLAFFVDDYIDVVEGELLSDLKLFGDVHRHLADFFLGTWADDTPKPFTNSEAVLTRHRVPQVRACQSLSGMPHCQLLSSLSPAVRTVHPHGSVSAADPASWQRAGRGR
jgi:hypothetical protein